MWYLIWTHDPGIKGFLGETSIISSSEVLNFHALVASRGSLNLLQAQLGPVINEGEIGSEKELVSNQIYLGKNCFCFFLEETILLSWAVSEFLICYIDPICLCIWTAVKSVLYCLTVKNLGAVLLINCPQNQNISVCLYHDVIYKLLFGC